MLKKTMSATDSEITEFKDLDTEREKQIDEITWTAAAEIAYKSQPGLCREVAFTLINNFFLFFEVSIRQFESP